MAKLTIMKLKCLGNAEHFATTWQVAKDETFTTIVDESLEDSVHLLEWITPLPKGDGTYYNDLDNLYARVKVHYRTNGIVKDSDFFNLNSCSQLDQEEKQTIYA